MLAYCRSLLRFYWTWDAAAEMPYSAYQLLASRCLETLRAGLTGEYASSASASTSAGTHGQPSSTGGFFPNLGLGTVLEIEEYDNNNTTSGDASPVNARHRRGVIRHNDGRLRAAYGDSPGRAERDRDRERAYSRQASPTRGGYGAAVQAREKENRPLRQRPGMSRKASVESLARRRVLDSRTESMPLRESSNTSRQRASVTTRSSANEIDRVAPPLVKERAVARAPPSSSASVRQRSHVERAAVPKIEKTVEPVRSVSPAIQASERADVDRVVQEQADAAAREEIAALGILKEGADLPDYGVAMEAIDENAILASPPRSRLASPAKPAKATDLVPGVDASAEMAPAAALAPEVGADSLPAATANSRVRKAPSVAGSHRSDAQKVIAMSYALSLLGEKFERRRAAASRYGVNEDEIEGSVRSVIVKAGQAIDRAASVSGSQYGNRSRFGGSRYAPSRQGGAEYRPSANTAAAGAATGATAGERKEKSRYDGSRYAGSRYAPSRFGANRSVAASVKLDETLPHWGF